MFPKGIGICIFFVISTYLLEFYQDFYDAVKYKSTSKALGSFLSQVPVLQSEQESLSREINLLHDGIDVNLCSVSVCM